MGTISSERPRGARPLRPETLHQLEGGVRGPLLTPESAGYDAARAVWNGMHDRRPAVIVRAMDAADVAAAVNFARAQELPLAVRGGGHNIAGNAVCDDGLVIDLSSMRAVDVDAERRTARVEAGALLGDVDRATQAVGLATPLGINSTTGVAGLTLGGGFGWLSRRFGLTVDNLRAVDIVTADGTQRRASEDVNQDLFWAVRGGGGNFGVVTAFEYGLHPVGPDVLAGFVLHPIAAAADVLRFYRDFVADSPEDVVCWAVLRQAPPLPFLAEQWHGRPVLILAMIHVGPDSAAGMRALAPLRAYGEPIADVVGPQPYVAWQTALDPLLAPGVRNYWKSHDLAALSDGFIDLLVERAQHLPDPQTEIVVVHLGGAVSRVPLEATAYTHRDADFVLNVHGRWNDPADDARCIAWARELFADATPYATGGAYVNFLTDDEGDRVRAVYGANYDRLVRTKTQYDPTNLFCLNQNIAPASAI